MFAALLFAAVSPLLLVPLLMVFVLLIIVPLALGAVMISERQVGVVVKRFGSRGLEPGPEIPPKPLRSYASPS